MPSEMQWPAAWTTSTVEQLTLDGAVTYGVVQPGPPVDVGRPMLRVNNFRGFGLDTSDVMHIASDVEAKYSRTRIRADDVLMTVVGSGAGGCGSRRADWMEPRAGSCSTQATRARLGKVDCALSALAAGAAQARNGGQYDCPDDHQPQRPQKARAANASGSGASRN